MKSQQIQAPQTEVIAMASLRKRLARAAVAGLYEEPAFQHAPTLITGCAMTLLGATLAQEDVSAEICSISWDRAIQELVGRGVDAETGRAAINYMVDRSVFIRSGDDIIIRALQNEMALVLQSFENRREGWKKRQAAKGIHVLGAESSAVQPKATVPVVNEVAPASATPVTATAPAIASPNTSALQAPAPVAPAASFELQGAGEASAPKKKSPKVLPFLAGQIPSADDEVIATMLTDGGEAFDVMGSYAEEVAKTYPAVDVHQQLLAAAAWLKVNPAKRKTLRGMPRFINTWLCNAQRDAAARKSAPGFGAAQQRNGFGQGSVDQLPAVATTTANGIDALDDLDSLEQEVFTAPAGGEVILADDGKGFDSDMQAPAGAQPNLADSEIDDFDLDGFLSEPANTGSFADGDLVGVSEVPGGLDDMSFDAPLGFMRMPLAA